MSRGLVYTLHLWPPIAHAKHYTGSTRSEKSLRGRLTDHALGRGARLTQVQVERGGSWVLARTEPGGTDRERQLKQHGATRRCDVCKAVKGYQAGELSQEQALASAGWDRASQHERGLLLHILGLSQPPENMPVQPGTRQAVPAPDGDIRVIPTPRLAPLAQYITPETVALVDQLQATWDAGNRPGHSARASYAAAEPEMEPQA